ncbi:NfeD family protein [Paenibacillus sp. JX-17]|uniref:NfeD family protein n=1 Tax=Paenibacillus lacisoli TaxID=3064525 RepID=A0ABT9CKE9_9BACL|nr:NfeD family protein [Paenibacillus sp. JX-17]MDO7908141.1 NfeD family protein [Paenibacillus sp. JX-17]
MEAIYWCFLVGGVLLAAVSVIVGDLLGGLLDGFELPGADLFKPVSLCGAAAAFGGTGVLLAKYTSLASAMILVCSLLAAAVAVLIIFFGYIRPSRNSEMSIGYSMAELSGRIGEVTVPIPAAGYGEVMVRLGPGNTIHTAVSFDRCLLAAGTRVVVVELQDGVLSVSKLET